MDRSYETTSIKEAIASKVMVVTYTRPTGTFCVKTKEKGADLLFKTSADIITHLHEILLKKIRLTGHVSCLGFLFLYELLLGSFPLRILSRDHPGILAHFLIRMMPLRYAPLCLAIW